MALLRFSLRTLILGVLKNLQTTAEVKSNPHCSALGALTHSRQLTLESLVEHNVEIDGVSDERAEDETRGAPGKPSAATAATAARLLHLGEEGLKK